MARIDGAGRRDRHLRHRRRRRRHLQHLDRGGARGRRLRRAGRQARQSRPVVEVRLGRRADGARASTSTPSSALVEQAIREAGIGFMMAPRHHGAMRHVAGPRVELGTRTIFNLLGPLSNPAGVKRQLIGVFAAEWVEPLARGAGPARRRARLGRARQRRARRADHHRPDPGRRVGRRPGAPASRSRPRRPACRAAGLEDLKGGDAGPQRRRDLRALLDGVRGPAARRRAPERRRRAGRGRPSGQDLREGAGAGGRSRSTAARRRRRWTGWSRSPTRRPPA